MFTIKQLKLNQLSATELKLTAFYKYIVGS